MSYHDDLAYEAARFLNTASRGTAEDGAADYERIRRSNIDPIHLAQQLAVFLASGIKATPGWEQYLDEQLAATRLFASVDIGSDEDSFLEPQQPDER